ncbi:MAG: pyruvate, phosphate dikinase [Gemmatimonadota bacterium]|nr:MAG: pyruvate, phosphate dikinase [Gemmatimonadota bacterium]
MSDRERSAEQLLDDLQERAKELNCLYRADEILSGPLPQDEALQQLVAALPSGWKYPEVCRARITLTGRVYQPQDAADTPWTLTAEIVVHGETVGDIAVSYTEKRPHADEGPFLREERRLINAIAERVGLYEMQRRLREDRESWEILVERVASADNRSWNVLVEFLQRTDRQLLQRITRKMINHLCWNGVSEAGALLHQELPTEPDPELQKADENRPQRRQALRPPSSLVERTFELAAQHLSESEIISSLQTWINEDKCIFLIQSLEDQSTTLDQILEDVLKFKSASFGVGDLSVALRTGLKVGLLHRLFVGRLDFVNVAKRHVEVEDFYDVVQHIIYPAGSHGKLGGKAAGLFLANRILQQAHALGEPLPNLKTPRTWYVASDGILDFIRTNQLHEVYDRKYMEIERVRRDYGFIIQVFKNSTFSPEVSAGLAAVLDDFSERPLIVRSSSMLEDQVGASFSGKYKSLFLANQGTKQERLLALQDAIAEIWASVFSPDPIEYRAERGLLDFREEMGILIQEVVGTRLGKYFLPAFAGVAFSNNEFRWSSRIRREDGLVRLVPGLGTRAVDRMSDDYPILMSPGQPGLRANVTADEAVRYAPKRIDVINLESRAFETIDLEELLRTRGDDYPLARQLVSLVEGDRLREPMGLEPDWAHDKIAFTAEGLLAKTPFVQQIQAVLNLLSDRLGTPVDVEFAHDGTDLYILQCRSQSHSGYHAPAAIPPDLAPAKLLFSAHRHVANGRVPNLTHIVYVDPDGYGRLTSHRELMQVARAVGKLNALLPRRRFVLMGPGRWGSRGDITLGVSVTYSDINNTAMLIEIARRKASYVPELSFGTHFFQDLVEADIRYLPLYPDDEQVVFQERFLQEATNQLPALVPEFAHLTDAVRVIDVARERDGDLLHVLMNADLDLAVGLLAPPEGRPSSPPLHGRWS